MVFRFCSVPDFKQKDFKQIFCYLPLVSFFKFLFLAYPAVVLKIQNSDSRITKMPPKSWSALAEWGSRTFAKPRFHQDRSCLVSNSINMCNVGKEKKAGPAASPLSDCPRVHS